MIFFIEKSSFYKWFVSIEGLTSLRRCLWFTYICLSHLAAKNERLKNNCLKFKFLLAWIQVLLFSTREIDFAQVWHFGRPDGRIQPCSCYQRMKWKIPSSIFIVLSILIITILPLEKLCLEESVGFKNNR